MSTGAVMPEAWMASARCAETDPEVFFQEQGGKPNAAKRICKACPVRAECLQHALAGEESGVWGGTTALERRRIRKARDQEAA